LNALLTYMLITKPLPCIGAKIHIHSNYVKTSSQLLFAFITFTFVLIYLGLLLIFKDFSLIFIFLIIEMLGIF